MNKHQTNSIPGAIIIEGHVQGLSNTRSLGEMGIPVIVIDRNNCIARYSRYCWKFYRCPDYSSKYFTQFLIDLAESNGLENWILIPSNDHAVRSIVNNKKALEVCFNLNTFSSAKTIETIYDKIKLLDLASKEEIPYPKTHTFANLNRNHLLPFPIMIKGRNGLSFYRKFGCKVFVATDEMEYHEILQRIVEKIPLTEVFLQEIIPDNKRNPTISFTAFSIKGEMKAFWTGEKLRQHPLKFGTATFCQSMDKEQLVKPSQRLLKALNYTGVCEIEYLLDPRDGEHKLIEINARTWLWVGLAKACGINYSAMIYQYAQGDVIGNQSGNIIHYKWANLLTDTPYAIIAILKGKLHLHEYISSFKGKVIKASFSWKDLKPALIFPLILILYTRKRKYQN